MGAGGAEGWGVDDARARARGRAARCGRWWSGRLRRAAPPALLAVALLAGSIAVLLPATPAATAAPAPAPTVDDTPTDHWSAGPPTGRADAVGGADALPAECAITPAGSSTVRCTYGPNAAAAPASKPQWWARPSEVSQVGVELYGAQGGSGSAAGGLGGKMTGTIALDPAVTGIVVKVGERGGSGQADGSGGAGGYPDGGAGGGSTSSTRAGCGGGGSSRLEINGFAIVVGGGGGCGGTLSNASGGGGGAGGLTSATGGGSGTSHGDDCLEGFSTYSREGTGGGAASVLAGGGAGRQGYYLTGSLTCHVGQDSAATAGTNGQGGQGAHGENSSGGGGGGGGGGAYGGGGGGGGQEGGTYSGGGGGGGGGTGDPTGGSYPSKPFTVAQGTNQTGEHAGAGSVVLTYQLLPTQTTLALAASSVAAGGTTTITADVVATPAITAPSGGVVFKDAYTGTVLCPETAVAAVPDDGSPGWVPKGRATCTYQPLTVPNGADGPNVGVVAEYVGGSGTSPSASPAQNLAIAKADTDVVVKAGATPGEVLFEVFLLTSTPTSKHVPIDGKVLLRDYDTGSVQFCVLDVVWKDGDDRATASCTVPLAPGETKVVEARYLLGTSTSDSLSAPLTLTMDAVGTKTTWTTADTTVPFGTPVTVTAFVETDPPTPAITVTGAVAFVDGATGTEVPGCASRPVSSGAASCELTMPAVGSHPITANYLGAAATKASSTASPVTITVAKATPTVSLTATPAGGSSAGEPVTLTAAVKLGASTPVLEGTITFRDGGSPIATCTDLPVAQATVTCTLVPTFDAGVTTPHTFSAAFAGSANVNPATSPPVAHDVGLAPTTTDLALAPPGTTGPFAAGTSVTVVATVGSPVAGATPAGTVAFADGGPIAGCDAVTVTGSGPFTASCTYVPSPGARSVAASYTPTAGGTTVASSTTTSLAFTVDPFATSTALTVSPAATGTGPVTGDQVTLTATVTTAGSGPAPTGTVAFDDAGATLPGCGAVSLAAAGASSATATCTLQPMGGAHHFGAHFGGDATLGASSSATTDYDVQAVGTTTTGVAASAASTTELALVATVAPATGAAVPTGAVTFSIDGTVAGAPCPLAPSGAAALASCTRPADPTTAHTIDATFTPADPASFLGSSGSGAYAAPTACSAGEVALWAALDKTPGGVDLGDAKASMTIAVGSAPGACDATPVPFTASAISLFGGLLTGSGSGVLAGGTEDGSSLCLTAGSLDAPIWMKVPTLDVSAPVCWSLTDTGGLGASIKGEITATKGRFPFIDLADAPATTASFSFTKTAGGASELGATFVASTDGRKVLELGLTIAADGAFTGSISMPGLVLFGQSAAGFAGSVSGGAGNPLLVTGTVTLGPIPVGAGLVIDSLTVTLSNTGFAASGTATIAVGGHDLQLTIAGTFHSASTWELTVSATGGPWEPLAGLVITPTLTGTVSSTPGEPAGPGQPPAPDVLTFRLAAGTPDGPPLVTWNPPGASFVGKTITLTNTDPDPACPAVPAGTTGHLVLGFAGSLTFGTDPTVAIAGCADLTAGAFHLEATATTLTLPGGLTLANLDLTADRTGGVTPTLALHGGGDVTIQGLALHLGFALTPAGAFVVGASADFAPWGLNAKGYVAYASAPVQGFDTHDPTVGEGGKLDLEAGLTADGVWTPDPNGPIAAASPQGLGLSSVHLHAQIGQTDVVLTADLVLAGLPFLPLGDAATTATITFTHGPTGNTLQVAIDATIGAATTVAIDLDVRADGSFTGSAVVDHLDLFGKDVRLEGSIDRTLVNAAFVVKASVTATIAGPIEVVPSVALTQLTFTLGTEKLAVAGAVSIGGKAGFAIDGTYYRTPAAGFEAGGWDLSISATGLAWSPTDGITFTADLHGKLSRKGSLLPVIFTLDASGAGGGDLLTFAPAGDVATLTVKQVAFGNAFPAPAGCSSKPDDLWLSVTGAFSVKIAGQGGSATGTGCFDLTSGQMSVSADLSAMSVDLGGARLHGPRFTVSREATTPPPAPGTSSFRVAAEVAIDVDIMGKSFSSPAPGTGDPRLTAVLVFTGDAFVVGVRANLGAYLSGVGGDAVLYFATAPVAGFDTGVPSLGKLDLVQGVNFAVRLTLPSSANEGLSKVGITAPAGAVTATGYIDTAAHAFSFKVLFQSNVGGQEIMKTSDGASMRLVGGFLKFTVKATDVSFGVGMTLNLVLPPVEGKGAAQVVPFTGELTISTTGIVVSLQVGDCKSNKAGWTNAFGISGLTVRCAAIQGGISYSGVPTFGFMGSILALPPDLADAIGYVQGAPIEFAFNLDPFMLSMSIGVKSANTVALRPLQAVGQGDLIRVRYASLYVAPLAVTIGQTNFPAGYGLGFQADIAGVDVDVLAAVDPNKPSISFTAKVSRIDIGALSIGPVYVDLLANPSDFHFTLRAAMKLGPGTLEIGPALRVGGELQADVEIELSKDGLAAFFSGHARGFIGAKLPHDVCYYGGFIPYPCDWWWEDAYLDLTLGRTGFSVDGEGITLSFDGHSITLPWSGGGSDAIDGAADPGVVDSSGVLAARAARGTGPVLTSSGPAGTADPATTVSTQAADDLAVATPVASDEPMATAPLPDELVIPAEDLVAGLSIVAPPTGPTGAEERPPGETTEVVVEAAPAVVEGTAPGAWTPTGDLHAARTAAVAATLPDGRVLVAGGSGSGGALASAEVYDPASGTWSATASLAHARAGASVATLPDGRVLVAGGTDGDASGDDVLASSEIYDPATSSWSAAPSLAGARAFATATVLADGRVLVAGGLGPDGPVATAERFDPADGGWHAVGPLATPRGFAAASRLADGKVLVAGGQGPDDAALASAELFDPATGTWQPTTAMPSSSMMDTATTLADGRVLVAGAEANAKLYDPATASWSKSGALGTIRLQAAAVTLPDGDVLLVGGFAGDQVETDGEIYHPATNAWQATTDLPVATAAASAVVLDDGSVLAVGGSAGQGAPVAAASIYRAVEAAAPVAFQAPAAAPAAVPTTATQLPPGGTNALPVAAFALALIALGAVLVSRSRRRDAAAGSGPAHEG